MKIDTDILYRYARFSLGSVPPPEKAIIDPIGACNLRCPLCPTGLRKRIYRHNVMSFESFRRIVDQIPSLKTISLFNWGEPFLNKELFPMISYARSKSISVHTHTNFSLKRNDDFFESIINSDLNEISISIDGATQASYEKYRIGGDLALVLDNVRRLQQMKASRKAANPTVTWQFIINRHNEHELAEAESLAAELGIQFNPVTMGLGDDLPDMRFDMDVRERMREWLPKDRSQIGSAYTKTDRKPLNNQRCQSLFSTVVVVPDGDVYPCCWITESSNAFGNIFEEDFEQIWGNAQYASARNLFVPTCAKTGSKKTVCNSCYNFKQRKKMRSW